METLTEVEITTRWMIRRDLLEVMSIERASFENPWDEAELAQLMQTRNVIGMVAEMGNAIHGYMIYELGGDLVQIVNLATDPCSLRCGIAETLVGTLKSRIAIQMYKGLRCEVRESNLRAQLFFRSMGFQCVDILHGWYDDTTDDAYVFEYTVPKCEGK